MSPAAEESYIPPDVPDVPADAPAEDEESDDYDIEVGGDDDVCEPSLWPTTYIFYRMMMTRRRRRSMPQKPISMTKMRTREENRMG